MDPEGSPDEHQLKQLIDQHTRAIHRFIGRRSGPELLKRTTVEDLFQETVATALSSADNFVFVDHARFLSWIYTIARRVMSRSLAPARRGVDAIRIRGIASSGVGVCEAELQAPIRTPSSAVAGRERRTALEAAIRDLPEHYRKVITLYRIEEHPLAEVAAAMGRTKGATCRLLARALATLHKRLPDQ
jgi:RNA polymerase sigma-70 factor (ECF subfamily)